LTGSNLNDYAQMSCHILSLRNCEGICSTEVVSLSCLPDITAESSLPPGLLHYRMVELMPQFRVPLLLLVS